LTIIGFCGAKKLKEIVVPGAVDSKSKPVYIHINVPYGPPFKREINRLSDGITCIAKKHCYNREIN